MKSQREMEKESVSVAGNPMGWKAFFSDVGSGDEERVDRRWVYGLVLLSFLIRIPLLLYPEVIHNDGTEYIRHARRILSGDWSVGRAHPAYPALIALAHYITPNDEMAGIVVSVVFGALLVLPVFHLGKAVFDERTGFLAGLFAVFVPFLHIYSGSVLTESLFHFLLATSVLFGLRTFQKGGLFDAALFGVLTAISYLTRPEGIGFLAVFSVWMLFVNPGDSKRAWHKRVGIVLVGVFFFLIVSFPYLLQIRKESGRWQPSKKVSMSLGSLSGEESGISVETIRVKKRVTLSLLLKSPAEVAETMGLGFLDSLNKFQQVFTPLLSLLLIFGIALSGGRSLPLKTSFFVASFVFYFFALVHPFFWTSRRYTSHVISICLPWAAFGFFEVARWARRRFAAGGFAERLPVFGIIGVLLVLTLHGWVLRGREHRVIQREAGVWMREKLPPGGTLMSSLPQEAFYAEMRWVRLPKGSYESILKTARSQGVRYLVFDEDDEKASPGFLREQAAEDLNRLKEWKRKDRWIVLFEVLDPSSRERR